VALGLAAGFACIVLGGRPDAIKPAGCSLLLAAGWFVGRAVWIEVLGANLGTYASSGRFMSCISPVFIVILFLGATLAATFLQPRIRRSFARMNTDPTAPIPHRPTNIGAAEPTARMPRQKHE
jgi:hypothetical protein